MLTLQSYLREQAERERQKADTSSDHYVQATAGARAEALAWVADLVDGLAEITTDEPAVETPAAVRALLQRLGEQAQARALEVLRARMGAGLRSGLKALQTLLKLLEKGGQG